MRLPTLASLVTACLLPGLAIAQPAPAPGPGPGQGQGQPGAAQPADPTDGAHEIVDLFGATCVQYAGNPAALRSWLTQQHAPALPADWQKFFLAGRQGQVFDVSSQSARLALVSADDGSCSTYADIASPALVVSDLESDMRQAQLPFAMQGDSADPRDPSLHHRDYRVTVSGQPWLILVTTSAAPGPGKPQAVITLHAGS